ncbi:MAG: reverse transcriptase domain-containing protein [Cetobacterium sp.]|uniref:reverse transcriptase domain-containing protein n=1 Tax=Cetobacterium sp. TaxID=2071632 RepID=UPI003F30A2EF
MNLDKYILERLTEENLTQIYQKYKETKCDYLVKEERDKRIIGEDGISPKTYDNLILKTQLVENLIKRIRNRKYLFKPFREIKISKDKSLNIREAKKKDKIRVLSVANIKDVLIQKIVYEAIKDYSENKFKKIDNISFAYREGKSAPCAVRAVEKIINEGYYQILNLDLSKFFDKIDHKVLLKKLEEFYGKENELLLYILKKFIKSYRITDENIRKTKKISRIKKVGKNKKIRYMKKVKNINEIFHHIKVKRERRKAGIPQGGILSGLLANIYLYKFDMWIVNELSNKFDIKYIRYADDFLIFFKDKEQSSQIYENIKNEMMKINLHIHKLGEKSEEVDLKNRSVEYLGFEIKLVKGKIKTRVKKKNLDAFKSRILEILNNIEKNKNFSRDYALNVAINKINFKISGNRAKSEVCPICNKIISYRSWIGFFGNITDIDQLIELDRWIFKKLSNSMYKKYRLKLDRKEIYFNKKLGFKENKDKLKSLMWEYYYYRRNLRKKKEVCECSEKEKRNYENIKEEQIPFY